MKGKAMPRVLLTAALVVGVLQCVALPARAGPSKLLGSWLINVSKLPVPSGGAAPKSVNLTIADDHDGKWTMTIDVVDQSGKRIHQELEFTTDGKPAPVAGSVDVDTVSVTCPDVRTMVMATSKNKLPSNTRIFSVSETGTVLTETIVSHGSDGTPAQRTNSWTRVR